MRNFIIFLTFFLSNNTVASSFCEKIDKRFKEFNWGESYCLSYRFQVFGKTENNNEIVFTILNEDKQETVLFMCGVHGDEITPVKFCFDLLKDSTMYKEKRIVIAPLVSPDSFFEKLSRTNANGVDINRNFPTKDWDSLALKQWNEKYRKDKRRFPGHESCSEVETKFQIELINKYKPERILSVHSPLQVFDYDGPVITHSGEPHAGAKLLDKMSKEAKNYRKGKIGVYPGSLGTWAGKERNIPTYTVELPSSNPAKHKEYWERFKSSLDIALKN